jgi:pimeloyl-ACP methyl ester carboxylesterase
MMFIETGTLRIAYELAGPADGPVVLLLHGWPDDVRGWTAVASWLHAGGFRTLIPYLRGFGPTRFQNATDVRDGRGVALAQDALDLVDALHIEQFSVAGHDWGARVAYTLAALVPSRLHAIAGLALPFQPGGEFTLPGFSQARRFWYQWFMCLEAGPVAVRADPVGFARIQWDTWSPPGWFDDAEFEETAKSFGNPDWCAITLHAYRQRWRFEPTDARYDALQARLADIQTLRVPTLMIQGGEDRCDEPSSSEGMERYFTGGYRRILLDDVGHFPAREAPSAVADALLVHFNEHR